MRLLKCWVLGVALSLGAVAVCAGPYEDSVEAYHRGDHSAAARLARTAAEQGDARAQYAIGWMYDEGRGVPRDDQQAVAWYRKAAEKGDAKAQYKLELMYAAGRGVPNGDHQAIPKADTSLRDTRHAAKTGCQ